MWTLERFSLAGVALGLLLGAAAPAGAGAIAPPAMFDRVVPDEQLATQRGGTQTQVFDLADLDARLDHNVARSNITGSNVVADGAFANASGLATIIQNSGNNVIIQNATILHLDLR